MKRVYIGRSGSGKTTKLLEDLKSFKYDDKSDKIAIFAEDSEMEKFRKIIPTADIFSRDTDVKSISLSEYNCLIVDTIYTSKTIEDIELPENVFFTFQRMRDALVLFSLDKQYEEFKIDVDKIIDIDEQINKEKECFVSDMEIFLSLCHSLLTAKIGGAGMSYYNMFNKQYPPLATSELQQVLPFISDSNSVNKNPISELSVKDSKKFLRLNKRRFKVFISKLNKEKNYISIPMYKFNNSKFHKNNITSNIRIARKHNLAIGFINTSKEYYIKDIYKKI